MKKLIYLNILFLLSFGFKANAQMGALDPSFGTGGFVTTDFGSGNDWARDILVQPDGKILLLGQTDVNNTTDIAMARLNSDGTSDLSFNSTGSSVQDLQNSQELPHEILLQPDGKILVCGKTVFLNNPPLSEDFFIARYQADGNPDLTFNTQGFNSLDYGGLNNYCYHMALDAIGRIVLVGMGYNQTSTLVQAEAFRFNADGSRDTTFALAGDYVYPQTFGEESTFRRVAVQPDGKILISGRLRGIAGAYDALVIRLNDDGSPDSTFSTDGIAVLNLGSFDEEVTAMVLQPDGKILLGGRFQDPLSSTDMAFVCRVLPNGNLDGSFGNGAISFAQISAGNSMENIQDMVLHPNGNIFLSGFSNGGAVNYSFSFFAFNDLGAPLTAFGNNGSIVHPYPSQTVTMSALAMQADYKLLACGILSPSGLFGNPSEFVTARIIGDMTTSLDFVAENKVMRLYPNPGTDGFFLPRWLEQGNLEIYDARGVLVMSIPKNSRPWVDTNALPEGFYSVRCGTEDRFFYSTWIKQGANSK
jgi:uncharacterized delta-60 repeat protein